jgi:acetylornithine/succinyldiaminopimelate/putrescine aminotransferase
VDGLSNDARVVLDHLGGRTRATVKGLAGSLGWSREGVPKAPGRRPVRHGNHRRVVGALEELRTAGLVVEQMSGRGSIWKPNVTVAK